MTGRIVKSADFERVLGAAPKARTEHFAVHHVSGGPSQPAKPAKAAEHRSKLELSTGHAPSVVAAVDDMVAVPTVSLTVSPTGSGATQLWFGLVVPKRHAKRAVTRSLFKRQIRAAVGRHASTLPNGLWVIRLRAPFEKAKFPSAASLALQRAARSELDGLLAGAVQRIGTR